MKNQLLIRLLREDSGQDMLEYALVAALIGLMIEAAGRGLSTTISKSMNGVGSALDNAVAN
jgi:pilus assembly protein Flp/PilA